MRGVREFSDFMNRIVVNFKTGCWDWTGYKVCIGYGRHTYQGKQKLAHRTSLLLYGWMTREQYENPKVVVMHECDNPSCINPYHLRIGTQRENIADRMAKGRCAKHLPSRDIQGRFKTKRKAYL